MKIPSSLLNMVVLVLFLWLTPRSSAQSTCESCLVDVKSSEIASFESYDGSFSRRICYFCIQNVATCFVCKLPALKNSRFHDDKRLFCDRDFANAIFASEEMDRMAYQTTLDLNRAFWRFKMNFAVSNVTVSLVSSASLYDLMGQRFHPQNAGTVGLTLTKCFDAENKKVKFEERSDQPPGTQFRYEHEIYVANGFSEENLKAIIAHELAHVWLHENLPIERSNGIDGDTVEGFCELVAYEWAVSENAVHVRNSIRRNLYTAGQQNILIEVESGYGFNRLLQWFYKGTNRRLQNADLVRQVNMSPLQEKKLATPIPVPTTNAITATNSVAVTNVVAASVPPPPAPVITLPTTVILKGIFYGKRRSALVNDRTLSEGEETQLKLADGWLGIKCLEIKPTSVILVVNGETKEYAVGLPPTDVVSGEVK